MREEKEQTMEKRFKTFSAVILMLIRNVDGEEEILLQKRKNTGYMDGHYDLSASGHVENMEPMTRSIIREAKEELDIVIDPKDLEFVTLIHKETNGNIYYNGYFKATKWGNEPKINEPEKNEELKWFKLNELPENLVNDRKVAIENYKNNIAYSEYGWKS